MKKTIAITIVVLLALGLLFGAVACTEDAEPLKIVYLGDSIAEAVLGPSPITERNYYGYFALVGKCNDMIYINRSVSGHKTGQLLDYLNREDDSAVRTLTHVREADVIHISILGNDMLQNSVGRLLKEGVEEKLAQDRNEDFTATYRENILSKAREDFAGVIDRLKELNPTAQILISTVYNPIYPDTGMVGEDYREQIAELGVTSESYRDYGHILIGKLNQVIWDYKTEHPDAFEVVDVYSAFDAIYRADVARGRNLIYPDDVHPSNEGHAVMFQEITKKLVELKMANMDDAIKAYRALRLEQLDRLYSEYDLSEAKAAINAGKTLDEITNAYFRKTADMDPDYAKGVSR